MSQMDWGPLWLTLKLALATTFLLLCLSTPIAWWLARSNSKLKAPIGAIIMLPLILPPSVLGFYLLLFLSPQGGLGKFSEQLGLGALTFNIKGLLIGSILYSLPFVVQPIQNSFESIGERTFELAATLRAGPWDQFFRVALPLARSGFFTAAILGFAHTIGEFGVVLMIGGNIPGQTRVLSVQIYDYVESMQFAEAHRLAGGLVVFSYLILLVLHLKRRVPRISL